MSLFQEWKSKIQADENNEEYTDFVKHYYSLEENAYKTILGSYPMKLDGRASELSSTLGFEGEMTIFMGFLDGINGSIAEPLDLETITEESAIRLEIDYEKLYWNMHEAKAEWLYNLKEWDQVLGEAKKGEIAKQFRQSKIVHNEKIGRNDPCPCGSGKKYKNCCLK